VADFSGKITAEPLNMKARRWNLRLTAQVEIFPKKDFHPDKYFLKINKQLKLHREGRKNEWKNY